VLGAEEGGVFLDQSPVIFRPISWLFLDQHLLFLEGSASSPLFLVQFQAIFRRIMVLFLVLFLEEKYF
jgi:hypothetical protein